MKGISNIHHLKKIVKYQFKSTKIQEELAKTQGEARTITVETSLNLINAQTDCE